jgi:hypothetical protein
MSREFWRGRKVNVSRTGWRGHKGIQIELPESAASELALFLKERGLGRIFSPEVLNELETALDFILVGDPASVAAHKRMEASKGMDPAESDPPKRGPGGGEPSWGEQQEARELGWNS